MFEMADFLTRVKAFINALLPEHWKGEAGERLRETVSAVSDYSQKNLRVSERLKEAPDILWETLKQKSSEALVNAAEEEQKRIATELTKQTLSAKKRQEEAMANKLETEAKILQVNELEARLVFVEKLRNLGMVCFWSSDGRMTFLKAPANYDWDGLTKEVITNADIQLGSLMPLMSFPNTEERSAGATVEMPPPQEKVTD